MAGHAKQGGAAISNLSGQEIRAKPKASSSADSTVGALDMTDSLAIIKRLHEMIERNETGCAEYDELQIALCKLPRRAAPWSDGRPNGGVRGWERERTLVSLRRPVWSWWTAVEAKYAAAGVDMTKLTRRGDEETDEEDEDEEEDTDEEEEEDDDEEEDEEEEEEEKSPAASEADEEP